MNKGHDTRGGGRIPLSLHGLLPRPLHANMESVLGLQPVRPVVHPGLRHFFPQHQLAAPLPCQSRILDLWYSHCAVGVQSMSPHRRARSRVTSKSRVVAASIIMPW